MEFLNEEKQTELGLTPEQVEGLKPLYNEHIAGVKQEWDGKANKDAEGILTGAAVSVEKTTGLKRNEGEKIADYITRAGGEYLKGKESEINTLKDDYEKKLKDFDGSSDLKTELENAKAKLDEAQQKYADYDALKEKAEQYEPIAQKYSELNLKVSFKDAMPAFPDTVNPYELAAKTKQVEADILKEWDVKFEDGKGIGVNKENPHKVEELKNLVAKHELIKELTTTRQQTGIGAKQKELNKIEGVPFDVPTNATSKERATLIKEYLAKEGISNMSPEYAPKFAELNTKMLQKTAS